MTHPLAELIEHAVDGHCPPVDGGWHRVEPWRHGLEAVVAFTGHAVLAVAADITDERLVQLGADGFGGAHSPRLIADLAGPGGWIDSLDLLLIGRGTRGPRSRPRLVARPDLATHPRVQLAATIREDLRILGYEDASRSAVVVVARGLAGLWEVSFELEPEHRGEGGAVLVRDALSAIPAGKLVVAAVAPGNAASLRSLLSEGFVPLGSLQLFRRDF